jgi:hypothetical protein
MFITSDNIRKYRQVARNITEERIEIYIREAISFDLLPVVGAELMRKFDALEAATLDKSTIEQAAQLGLTPEEYTYLMGGFWTDASGVERQQNGLREAACYFAYARFVRNHATQTTPFGIVVKEGEDSNAATPQMIASVSRDAQVIGEQVLRDAAAYWKAVCEDKNTEPKRRQHHFVAIGD